MAEEVNRRQLELTDEWKLGLELDSEGRAHSELAWLMGHNNIREYLLVRQTPKDTPYVDPLDDEVLF